MKAWFRGWKIGGMVVGVAAIPLTVGTAVACTPTSGQYEQAQDVALTTAQGQETTTLNRGNDQNLTFQFTFGNTGNFWRGLHPDPGGQINVTLTLAWDGHTYPVPHPYTYTNAQGANVRWAGWNPVQIFPGLATTTTPQTLTLSAYDNIHACAINLHGNDPTSTAFIFTFTNNG